MEQKNTMSTHKKASEPYSSQKCADKNEGMHCKTCSSRVNSIFKDLQEPLLSQLDLYKTTNTYKKGQTLFYEGSLSQGVFCIASGQVKLVKNGENGKEVLLRIAKGGSVLGVRALLSQKEAEASAHVMDDAHICFVDKQFMNQLIHKNQNLALNIILRMDSHLDAVETRLTDIQNKDVRQRLSNLLLVLGRTHGKKQGDEILLDTKLTRAELGSMVDSTPETVIRTLSDFNALGHIRLDGKKIFIANQERLMEEASFDH